jgi:hypothetical protein
MAKPKHEPGTFLRIPLSDGSFGYGRLLEAPLAAFYDYRTAEPSADLDVLTSRPVLFTVGVRRRQGRDHWEAIGKRPLAGKLAEPVVQFLQDLGNPRSCKIFDTAGMERDVTPEECVGVERAAVWESSGVEERLLDTLLGRPNAQEVRGRVRLE